MEDNKKFLNIIIPITSHATSQPGWFSKAAKRLFDILVSSLGLFALAPFFAIIAVQIKRSSAGPVFFRGLRMGRGEKPFHILKFRTMYECPESYAGAKVTGQGDSRITPLGKWLRDTKLNELPQLWNVLIGEMSLVGPRPEDPEIALTWPHAVRQEILSVRPGITSPSSVANHDEEKRLKSTSVMDDYFEQILPDKLRLDQLYVRHHNFITDLDAILWTFVIMIPRLGNRKIPEGWLFGGPFSRIVRRYMSWTSIDFVVALLSIGFVGVIWRLGGPLDIGLWKAAEMSVLLALLFSFFNVLLGLKSVEWSRAAPEDVLRLFVSCGLVILMVVILEVMLLAEPTLPPRFMIASGLLVLLNFIAVRYRLRLITGLASRWITLRKSSYGAGERVLIVGAGEGSEFATWLLSRTDFRRLYHLVGIVDDDPSKQGLRLDGLHVLGTAADIPEIVRRHDVGVLFFAISKISPADHQRILNACKRTTLPVIMISEVLQTLHSQLTKQMSGDNNMKTSPGRTAVQAAVSEQSIGSAGL